jgi:alanine racemase
MTERAEARIDAGAIERNCATVGRALTGGAELCVAVKADGYGHGAVTAARAALAGGASRIAVVSAPEAEQIRAALPEARIFVMGALSPEELARALAAGAELGVWRDRFRRLASRTAADMGTVADLHVKHDSGMGRLGEADPEVVAELADAVAADENLELAGLWTHFATADEADTTYFEEQLARFEHLVSRVRLAHPGITVHAANSAATLREPRAHFDMVRCGVAVYGMDPYGSDPADHGLEPALELRSYVADVKRFAKGDSAGYGRTWRAPRDTWVGVLPIGYGDGVRRALSNDAEVLIGGRRYPLVGTISMDNSTVDLGADTEVAQGAEAVLIGAQGGERVLAEEWARKLETINYEITTAISQRVPRRGAE